jgi:AcrR family transcriptional regulator
MAPKRKRDWFEEGLRILAEQGAKDLTIELLTARLGVTKGSFYHHFENYQDFKQKLLDFYEHEGTLEVIKLTEQANTPLEKFEQLMTVTVSYPPELEIAFRAWALQDDLVRTFQERIDSQRLGYLQEIAYALTNDETQALLMAQLIYTIYIGSQHIVPPIQGEGLEQLYQEFNRLYGLAKKARSDQQQKGEKR